MSRYRLKFIIKVLKEKRYIILMTDLDFFRTEVKSYDSLDAEIKDITDKIKPLNLKLKDLKSKKSELQGNICEYMAQNDIDTCNLKSGRLVYKESKAVKPVTQADVKDSIIKFYTQELEDSFSKLSSAKQAEILIEFIYEKNRESSTKSTLRRAKGQSD